MKQYIDSLLKEKIEQVISQVNEKFGTSDEVKISAMDEILLSMHRQNLAEKIFDVCNKNLSK